MYSEEQGEEKRRTTRERAEDCGKSEGKGDKGDDEEEKLRRSMACEAEKSGEDMEQMRKVEAWEEEKTTGTMREEQDKEERDGEEERNRRESGTGVSRGSNRETTNQLRPTKAEPDKIEISNNPTQTTRASPVPSHAMIRPALVRFCCNMICFVAPHTKAIPCVSVASVTCA